MYITQRHCRGAPTKQNMQREVQRGALVVYVLSNLLEIIEVITQGLSVRPPSGFVRGSRFLLCVFSAFLLPSKRNVIVEIVINL